MSADRFSGARAVADAVLYEGYLLYPYRASATKNQFRWQFGLIAPPSVAAVDPSERVQAHTEVIVDPGQQPQLLVRLRFLEVRQREDSWDDAIERELDFPAVRLLPLSGAQRSFPFAGGEITVTTRWAEVPGALIKVAVTVANTSTWARPDAAREEFARHSLVGAHVLMAIDDGVFVSPLDPDSKECASDGLYPVLVGEADDVVLASPIILSDHPVIAPESQGMMFDATEIDEILALRILTLSDGEKAEVRRTDERAAAILDRVEAMPPEMWAQLHGTVRSIQEVEEKRPEEALPWWEPAVDEGFDPWKDTLLINGREVGAGTSVMLRPNRRADAHDMFLAGMRATVTGVFTDVDDKALIAVTVDDDPATELLAWQRRGFFFHPDELEVVA